MLPQVSYTDIPVKMPKFPPGSSATIPSPFSDFAMPESPAHTVRIPCPDAHYPFLRSVLPEPSLFIGTEKTETENSTPEYRVSDIFRKEGKKLLGSKKLSPEQAKAVFSIMNCRTETYGYHADVCDECGFIEVAYNSCRNRHCPQCQGIAKRRWVNDRLSELLPISYHHVVFTVPSYISMLSLYNQKIIYNLLFQAAAQTLLTFGRDPKFLGAEIGFYGVLHTWSQTLGPHIHIHFIVTAGGLTEDGEWKEPKHSKKFLFPVRAVSKVFRGKFIEGLKELYYNGEITIPDSMEELNTPEGFEKKLNALVSKSWMVHSKPPFSGPEEVVRYIGRYTHRIAISDSRIIAFENGQVTFSYKDNKEKDPDKKYKEMTLNSEEFVRRFLYHILPHRYHRIRNYGFLSNGRKKQNIEIIKKQLPEAENTEILREEEAVICPICKKGKMKTFLVVNGYGQIAEYDPTFLNGGYRDTS
jgi:hypothetical protein